MWSTIFDNMWTWGCAEHLTSWLRVQQTLYVDRVGNVAKVYDNYSNTFSRHIFFFKKH